MGACDAAMKKIPVLLVDDDNDLLQIGKEFLEDDGRIAVETALSAEDALKRITVQPFDVIICDYRMPPGMDSTGLLKAMKAEGIDIPLIVFSGFAREEHAAEAIKNGATFYLQKSVPPEVQYTEMKNLVLHLSALRDAQQALFETRKESESFAYSVSHDLRAPLRIIDGYCRILSDKYGASLPAEAQQHISRLRAATVRMDAYFEDLLQLSRAGRLPLKDEQVNLSSLSTSILGELPHPATGPRFMQEIEKDVIVQGDRALLERAMQQILDNSCKYTKNRQQVRIAFGTMQDNGRAICFVRDNGEGFDAANAKDLFTPFHRFHPESQFPGTGIGLAIVQKIISRHDGSLWVESTVDGGTTVFFTFHDGGIGPPK
ncbi:MAG: response regulator [Methanomicrobiales archaeon]|nr:response regulator [Methanomicrobiales archaeon]